MDAHFLRLLLDRFTGLETILADPKAEIAYVLAYSADGRYYISSATIDGQFGGNSLLLLHHWEEGEERSPLEWNIATILRIYGTLDIWSRKELAKDREAQELLLKTRLEAFEQAWNQEPENAPDADKATRAFLAACLAWAETFQKILDR